MGGEGGVSNGKVSGFHAAEFAFFRLAATFISVCRGGIYPSRGRLRRRGVSGPIWNRPLHGFAIMQGLHFPGDRSIYSGS